MVIDKMIYSYGGITHKDRRLGIVYRLDPAIMEWFEVTSSVEGRTPYERSHCCLCAIGSKMILFGGSSGGEIPRERLQFGATVDEGIWTNEIYEFCF